VENEMGGAGIRSGYVSGVKYRGKSLLGRSRRK
jgi:hypothetical protein